MNQRNFLTTIFTCITMLAVAQTSLRVVPIDSKVAWTGTKITGSHQGIVKIKEGNVIMQDQKITGGYFVIDMSSITCTDIPASDPIPKKRLEDHLKGPDFFDVVKYPTAKFEIEEVRQHPDNPAKRLLKGNLTIKGVTKVEIEPTTETDKLFIALADLRFDRQVFGVVYKGLADELVHDIVKLNIVLKAK